MLASGRGHAEVIRLLLGAGADVNVQSNDGSTALMPASMYNHPEVVRLLLGARANVNVQSNNGWTALALASHFGHVDVVRLLSPVPVTPSVSDATHPVSMM
jgi:ankyrin repeat protein